MAFDIVWTRTAQRQAADIERWWRSNRELAPGLFRAELDRTIRFVEDNPQVGVLVKGRTVRRILLTETRRHLYYRVRPALLRIEVVAIRGAVRQPR